MAITGKKASGSWGGAILAWPLHRPFRSAATGFFPIHRRLARALTAAVLLLSAPLCAAGEALSNAENLQQEAAQAAAAGEPLLVLYSRSNCPYCERVKREFLLPLQKDSRNARLPLRQINQDSDAPLTDFQGQPTRHAAWSKKEKVKLVPVVAFYGPDGQRLAEPLVGLRLPDFYGAYLEDQLAAARLALRAGHTGSPAAAR